MCWSGHGAMIRRQKPLVCTLFILLVFLPLVPCLRCYECENSENPACGEYFKAYQFQAKKCGDGRPYFKCALQRQPATDGWVGIARVCYEMGTLYGINETDGCREWTNDIGFTALYCFCSTNFCNTGSNTSPNKMAIYMTAVVTLLSGFLFK